VEEEKRVERSAEKQKPKRKEEKESIKQENVDGKFIIILIK
jgi:hypothetical protein|tara:strand:+ start:74 stop:196 length:123 start_codon:yes stop_codon:yes gene_type:complete